jgi:hypothetical protein
VNPREHTEALRSILSVLRSVRKTILCALVIEYLLHFVIVISVIICVALLVDLAWYLEQPVRSVFRILLLLVTAGFTGFFIRSFLKGWHIGSVVTFLEHRFIVLKGRLFAAMECSPEDPCFSRELVYANMEDAKNVLDSLPPIPLMERRQVMLRRIAYIPLLLVLGLIALAPQRGLRTLARIGGMRDPFPTCFAVYPGNGVVERGYGFDIVLYGIAGRIFRPKAVLGDGHRIFREREAGVYLCTIEQVEQPFTYQVVFSDTASGVYFVDVVEHPRIEDIQFTIRFPAYTRVQAQQTREFDLYALKGSEVFFEGVSSQPLSHGTLLFTDSIMVRADIDSTHFSGSFLVDTTRSFVLQLKGKNGLTNVERPTFRVFSFLDEYPQVELVTPGEDIDLPHELAVDLVITADDDYGISSLALVWEQDGESHTVPIEKKKDNEVDGFLFHWDLMNLPLFPGDTLTYYARAYDTDVVSGPKMGRSKTYRIRFPTAEEIYEEVAGGGEKLKETFETESGKLDELKEGLKELEQSLRESRNLTWEEKKQAEEIVRKERELLEHIEQAREEMEQLTKRINDAFLSNPEIREKLEEIERLMKELATEEVRHHMEQLRKAMERMDRREMVMAMENMILSQEEIKKKLERTIQILERIAQEERFEKIVDKVEQLTREQKRINKEMETREGAAVKELSDEQQALQEELEELSGEMDALAKELGKSDSTAKASLEESQELSSELLKQLEEMQDAMQRGQKQKSLSFGAQSEEKLGEMSAMLSAGLSSMMSKRRSDLEDEYNALINNVIFLSSKSEKIMVSLEDTYGANEVLASQDGVRDGTAKAIEGLASLKAKSPFISQIAEEELYRAIRFIEQSGNYIMNGNSQGALQFAKRAMKSLNLAALELIESKENMPASGSSSLSQMLQQLQSLASGQMQVNQGTQAMLPIDISGGTVPEQTQRELQRLSELQSSLAERLRRVEEGLQEEGGDVLGDLGKVADEMDEVVEKLAQYSLDREVVERQERILSRMLDAQRSVHKREFSKKREAERPGEVSSKSPPPLPGHTGSREDLKKDILKELEEDYPQEYRDLIRAYFKRLLREEAD